MKEASGAYHLVRRERADGRGFYPGWQIYLRPLGQKAVVVASGFEICGACLALPRRERGDQSPLPDARARCRCRAKAAHLARETLRRMNEERIEGALNGGTLGTLGALRSRREFATIGEVCAAISGGDGARVRKSAKDQRRLANDLRLVVARALDLWTVQREGGGRGWRVGERRPDAARIDALPLTVLDADFVPRYFRGALGEEELDWIEPVEGGAAINSTLRHVRDIFAPTGKVRTLLLRALKLPDLAGFLGHPLLPQFAATPEPIHCAFFDAMTIAARAAGDVGIVNLILRQTGMRSYSVAMLHRGWLRRLPDGWWVDVRDRKGGTAEYSVPVSEELATLLQASPTGYAVPGADEAARMRLVNVTHNGWLKGGDGAGWAGIGAPLRGDSGNHRLRDTVGSAALSWLGRDVASELLGHAEKRTLDHYARLRVEVSSIMRAEGAAWSRVGRVV